MEKSYKELELLEKWRIKWMTINLLGFCIWDGLRIGTSHFWDKPSLILTIVMWIGWVIWVAGFVQLTRLSLKSKKTKQALEILNDELVEFNRLKAWRAALLMVGLLQVIIILLISFGIEISGLLAADLSIFVAVVSAIGGFLYYNTELNG